MPVPAQHRHSPGDDEEDQLQAHMPKIIARQPEPDRPPGTVRVTEPTAFGTASAQVAHVSGTHGWDVIFNRAETSLPGSQR
jgi:hypothetical protein